MAEINIYFQDLKEEFQEALMEDIQEELLDYGEVAPKGKNESDEEYNRRLQEEAAHYINTQNFANRFVI